MQLADRDSDDGIAGGGVCGLTGQRKPQCRTDLGSSEKGVVGSEQRLHRRLPTGESIELGIFKKKFIFFI